MTPVHFPESNARFGPPSDLAESQCMTIHAYHGKISGGSVDGATVVVTAWKPSPEEIEKISKGSPIFISCLGGLPPHFLTTDFDTAVHPS